MKTDLFQSCGHSLIFPICWHIECSTFTASAFRIWNSSIGIPSHPLALFVAMLSKAHLTSLSRISGSRLVITPSWLSVSSEDYGFSCGHVWMWELDHKEGWAPNNWCFWTVVLEKTLESLLDCKEISPVNLKGNQSWIFIGRTDAEAEAPLLWPPNAKCWFIWKAPNAGKIEGKRRGWQRMRWLNSITNWMDRNLSKLHETVEDRGA